jgi:hypothetical protein
VLFKKTSILEYSGLTDHCISFGKLPRENFNQPAPLKQRGPPKLMGLAPKNLKIFHAGAQPKKQRNMVTQRPQ